VTPPHQVLRHAGRHKRRDQDIDVGGSARLLIPTRYEQARIDMVDIDVMPFELEVLGRTGDLLRADVPLSEVPALPRRP
jgi:hypothetical protein